MHNLSFALDKSAAAVYEGIALLKIEEWYLSQGLKVHARYNEENGLEGKRGFDLVDGYGKRWEVKADRIWGHTGNVFFEHIAVQHSQADYFLILAGFAYILPRETVFNLIKGQYRVVPGGDDGRDGTLVPLSELSNLGFVI
jgi:hypothetical protein